MIVDNIRTAGIAKNSSILIQKGIKEGGKPLLRTKGRIYPDITLENYSQSTEVRNTKSNTVIRFDTNSGIILIEENQKVN